MRGKVEDLVLFLADTATTLKSFVSIFPLGAKCFWEAGALSKLATFYDDVFPSVQHLWKTVASRFVHSQKETIWVVGYSGGRWGRGEGRDWTGYSGGRWGRDWLFRCEVAGEGLVIWLVIGFLVQTGDGELKSTRVYSSALRVSN